MAEPLTVLLGAVAGAAVGSFLATAVLRHERGEPWWRGRSHCPHCGRILGVGELVPVVSRLLWPRCRGCGAPIDPLHTVGELGGLGVGGLALAGGLTPGALLLALFGWAAMVPALVDLREGRLPLSWSRGLLVAGLVVAGLRSAGLAGPGPELPQALLAAGLAGLGLAALRALHRWLRGREGMGWGDVEFAAGLGAWLEPHTLPTALLLAASSGLVYALARGAWRNPTQTLPFGPHLALGAVLVAVGGI